MSLDYPRYGLRLRGYDTGHSLNLLTNWLLRNPEFHYRPYISPPLVPIFSKSSPGSIPTPLKSILILSPHLRLGLPKGLLPLGFPTKTLYAFLDRSIRATCPAHFSHLDLRFLIMLDKEYNACSSALCILSLFSCNFISLSSNIFLSTLFSDSLNLCSSLNVREQVSQPYNTTENITH